MVGLTQFVIWVILSIGITAGVQSMVITDKYEAKQVAENMASQGGRVDQGDIDDMDNKAEATGAMEQILGLPFGKLIFCFLFYFLAGYLLYASFFAAIGGAVDSETDSQQFMLPVTIPIIFAIVMMQFVLNNPDGPVAFWLSMIPLTSPIIMMVRVPFDPPMWQIAVSMVTLVLTFILSTWLAGRVYRTGILMYGKKASWRELGKWLFYKG
jgi:ABC-2 type transport system permease protein